MKSPSKKVVPHGKGTMTLIDGSIVTGEFINGQIDTTKDVVFVHSSDLHIEDTVIINEIGQYVEEHTDDNLIGFLDKYHISTLFNEQSSDGQNSEMNKVGFTYKGKVNLNFQFTGHGEIAFSFFEGDKLMYKLVYVGEFSDGDIDNGRLKSDKMLFEGEVISQINYEGEFYNDYSFAEKGELSYESITNTDLINFQITREDLEHNGESYTCKRCQYKNDNGVLDVKYLVDGTVEIQIPKPKNNERFPKDNDLFKYYYLVTYRGKIKDGYKLTDGTLELRRKGEVQCLVIDNKDQKDNYLGAFISYKKLLVLDGEFYLRSEESVQRFKKNGHHTIFDRKMLWRYGYTFICENDTDGKEFQKFLDAAIVCGIGAIFVCLSYHLIGGAITLGVIGELGIMKKTIDKVIPSISKYSGVATSAAKYATHRGESFHESRDLEFIRKIFSLLKLNVKSSLEKIEYAEEKSNCINKLYRDLYSNNTVNEKRREELKALSLSYKHMYNEICKVTSGLKSSDDEKFHRILKYHISDLIYDVEQLSRLMQEIDNCSLDEVFTMKLGEIKTIFIRFYLELDKKIDLTEKYINDFSENSGKVPDRDH